MCFLDDTNRHRESTGPGGPEDTGNRCDVSDRS